MNPNTDETLLARWLDGEMTADERAAFESRMGTEPALREEAEMLQHLRRSLQAAIPRQTDVPHGDFFNSQIMRHIEVIRAHESRAPASRGALFGWLRLPWLAIGAACVAAMLGYNYWEANRPKTIVMNMYAPHTGISAKTYHSKDANATVLELEGLAAVPADRQVVGYRVDHSETNQEVAMTTLFGQDGHVLLVLAKDGMNQPQLIAH